MPSNPSLGWQKLRDVYYSINPCYEGVNWPLDNVFSNYHVRVSPETTLVALASKFVPHPNVIEVYAITGVKLWSLVYNSTPQDHIVDFCFHGEDLCVVLTNQRFRLYTDFLGTYNEYSYRDSAVKLADTGSDEPVLDETKYVIRNLENNEIEDPFHVVESNCWGRYLVLRFKNRVIITDLHTFTNYELLLARLSEGKVHCMSLLSCADSSLDFLLSYESTVYKVMIKFHERNFELVDEALTDGPFSMISTSPNGAIIALLNPKTYKIFVISKDFDRILLEYDTSNESSLPYMIEWAGNDAIVLSLRDEIKLIGPGQRSISFFYDIIEQDDFDLEMLLTETPDNSLSFTVPILKSERDGLKIITKNKVEFLSRVPESTINLHLIGSSHPSFILLDCVDKLLQQSSKADSNISLLKNENSLATAISGCLDAALDEFSPIWQKKILKAASFGKIYEKDFDADEYLKVVNTVKVLNQIRSPEIGIFLTHSTLLSLGWLSVIEMLLRRSQHLLALTIVDLLKLEDCRSLIYVHWCCCKIKKEMKLSDVELFKIIATKLLTAQRAKKVITGTRSNLISVSPISEMAFQEGRIDLCKLLINIEPSIIERVNQLLQIEETELLMIKCFQTSDFDLCKLILLHFKDNLSLAQLFRLLNQNEQKGIMKDTISSELKEDEIIEPFLREKLFINGDLIGNFWVHTIGKYDPKLLDAYYKHEDKSTERTLRKLTSIAENAPFENSTAEGESAHDKKYQYYKDKLQPLTNNRKLKRIVQQELDLLELKRKLSDTFRQSFFEEVSLMSIITRLIRMYQLKLAAKIAKDFKLEHERFWNMVVDTYCKTGEFDRLYKFVTTSNPATATNWKSPIGFETIALSCIEYDGPRDQISTYISHCSTLPYQERIRLYLKIEDLILAADEAYHNKDADWLQKLQKMAETRDGNLVNTIKNYLTKLGY